MCRVWAFLGICGAGRPLALVQKRHRRFCCTYLTIQDSVLRALHCGVVVCCGHGVLCCFVVVSKENRVVCEVQIRLSCMALVWVSARSGAFCPTYLTLQDAVLCVYRTVLQILR